MAPSFRPLSTVEQYVKARLTDGDSFDKVETRRVIRDFRLWADSRGLLTTTVSQGVSYEMNERDLKKELMALGYRIVSGETEDYIARVRVDWNLGHTA